MRLTARFRDRPPRTRSRLLLLLIPVVVLVGSPAVVAYAAFSRTTSVSLTATAALLVAPGAPAGTCVNRVANLSWAAVAYATGYTVYATPASGPGAGVSTAVASVPGASATVPNLRANTNYTFHVRSTANGWTGALSAASASLRC